MMRADGTTMAQTFEQRGMAVRTVLGYLKPYGLRVACGVSIKFVAAVLELVLPLLLAHVIDDLVPLGDHLPDGRGHGGSGVRRHRLQHHGQPHGRMGFHGDDPESAAGPL